MAIHAEVHAIFIHGSDVSRSLDWYSRLLGLAEGQISHEGLIGDLPVPGPTRIILDGHGAAFGHGLDLSRPRIMFAIDDIDLSITHVGRLGLEPTPIEDIGSAVVTDVDDPDGNRVCLIQHMAS